MMLPSTIQTGELGGIIRRFNVQPEPFKCDAKAKIVEAEDLTRLMMAHDGPNRFDPLFPRVLHDDLILQYCIWGLRGYRVAWRYW